MKKFIFVGLFILFANSSFAQQATLAWDTKDAKPLADTFTYSLKLDTLNPIPLTPACIPVGTGSTCSALFILPNPTATHTFVLTVRNPNCVSATPTDCIATATLGPGDKPTITGFKVIIIQQASPQ